jgi:hypothetical protein
MCSNKSNLFGRKSLASTHQKKSADDAFLSMPQDRSRNQNEKLLDGRQIAGALVSQDDIDALFD